MGGGPRPFGIDAEAAPEVLQLMATLPVEFAGFHFYAGSQMLDAATVVALLEHPEQIALLQDNPKLISSAVDEILRWTSPVISFLRTATEDFQLVDKKIREGDTVCMFYPSANRDDTVFKDPYRFDITRDPNPYITFGFGAHFCLGTNLAKAELRAALKALLPVLPRLERAGEGHRIPNTHVSGFAELPVRLKK
jgi:cytochrome P450